MNVFLSSGKAEEPPASPSPTPPVALDNENIDSNSTIEVINVPPPAPTSVRYVVMSNLFVFTFRFTINLLYSSS